jgi:hypothetical protein
MHAVVSCGLSVIVVSDKDVLAACCLIRRRSIVDPWFWLLFFLVINQEPLAFQHHLLFLFQPVYFVQVPTELSSRTGQQGVCALEEVRIGGLGWETAVVAGVGQTVLRLRLVVVTVHASQFLRILILSVHVKI